MELVLSLLPLLVVLSSAYLLGAVAGRKRFTPPRTQPVQPPPALDPAQQCEWMSQWYQRDPALVHSHGRRHGRHAA